jgi:lysophospholipid acyltransferase (LPLAT)-like uncharacterized protein
MEKYGNQFCIIMRGRFGLIIIRGSIMSHAREQLINVLQALENRHVMTVAALGRKSNSDDSKSEMERSKEIVGSLNSS